MANGHLDTMIVKVFDRLKRGLVLIVEAKGVHDLVETKRGKHFANLDLPIDLTNDTGEVPDLIPAADLYDEEEI